MNNSKKGSNNGATVAKGILGFAIGAAVGITIAKMAKSGNLDIHINEDALRQLIPKKPKVINPNGENYTVPSEDKNHLIKLPSREENELI